MKVKHFKVGTLAIGIQRSLMVGTLLSTGLLLSTPAIATDQSTQATRSYNVLAGSLSQVIHQFAEQSGVLLNYDARLVEGKTSQGLTGSYTVIKGFNLLLAAHGLEIQSTASGYTVIPKARSQHQTRDMGQLQQIDVKTKGTGNTYGDAIQLPVITVAAENENSYTTKSSSTATRLNLSLKETPQTINVVTQKQIEDFNLTDMDKVLQNTSGVFVINRGSNGSEYYSRGFTLQTQYDGMANPIGISSSNWNPSPDSAFIERTEVQQGAAGLLSGAGEPGGTINMIRKRPTQTFQANGSAQIGSWDKRRVTGDVSGALTPSGNVRGRVVTVWDESENFIDYEYTDKIAGYAAFEADLTNSTLLTANIQYQKNEGRKGYGVPNAANGQSLNFPRSSYFGHANNLENKQYTLYSIGLEQQLPRDWLFKISYNYNITDVDGYAGSWLGGTLDPLTGNGLTVNQRRWLYREGESQSLDTHLNGKFSAFGRFHDLTVGANGVELEQASRNTGNVAVPINIYTFDPRNLPEPTGERGILPNPDNTRQYGMYGVTRLNLTDSLKAILGTRISWYTYKNSAGIATHDESGVISPYGGLVYDLNDRYAVYASYSDIFKAQNSKDRTGQPLDPVLGSNYEIGIKGEFFDNTLNTTFALYRLEQTNLAKRDDAFGNDPGNVCNGWCYIAQDKVTSEGVDFNVNGQLQPNWNVSAGYTFVGSKYASGVNEGKRYRSNSPRHIITASTTYTIPNSKLTIGANLKAQSAFYLEGTNYRLEQDKLILLGLMAKYQLNDKIDVSLAGNNLFDKTYWAGMDGVTYSFYGEPRNYLLTLRARY